MYTFQAEAVMVGQKPKRRNDYVNEKSRTLQLEGLTEGSQKVWLCNCLIKLRL